MHCSKCNKTLAGTDSFCAGCGTAVGGSAPTVRWETCAITMRRDKGTSRIFRQNEWQCEFVAHGIDSSGDDIVIAVSPTFTAFGSGWPETSSGSGEPVRCHNKLVAKLQNDGWELVGKPGPEIHWTKWYGYEFKRQRRS